MQTDSPPTEPSAAPESARSPAPDLATLFRVWLAVGVQSFGGGSTTLALIRRAYVERHRWATEAEFIRDWAICQMAPGINLFALAILLGRRTNGVLGIGATLLGLLLPSVTLTILMTAGYQRIQRLGVTEAALRGVVPAIVGLGLLTSWQLTRPLMIQYRQEGSGRLLFGLALLAGSALAVALLRLPVFLVLLGAAGLGAAAQWAFQPAASKEEPKP